MKTEEEKNDFLITYDLQDAYGLEAWGLDEHSFINRLVVPILYHSDEYEEIFNLRKYQYVRKTLKLDSSGLSNDEEAIMDAVTDLDGEALMAVEYALIKESVFHYFETFEYMTKKGKGQWTRYKLTDAGLEWLMEYNHDY